MFEAPVTIQVQTTAAIHGDSTALGTVFQFYRPRLLAHALRICGNTPLAQDAVQDTFISAFTHLQSLKNADSFYPWLKRILVNICYRLLSKERFTELTDHNLTKDSLIHQSIDEHFEKISNRQRMFEALRFLSDELRSCIMLRYFSKHKSYDRIAEVLGIPVGTVRSRLAAAREKLATHFIRVQDADDVALNEGKQWSEYYFHSWSNMYDDEQVRNNLYNHILPGLSIRFTSGKSGIGRKILETEIDNDLYYGSRFTPGEVISSGNITLIEGPNFNNPDYPDRCSPETAFILFRSDNKVATAHIFDSPRH